MKRVSPKSRAEARNWNFYNSQDEFHKIRAWPVRYQQLGVKPHLGHFDAYKLFTLFVFNGLDPNLAAYALNTRHSVTTGETRDLVKNFRSGKFNNHKGIYDFELDRGKK